MSFVIMKLVDRLLDECLVDWVCAGIIVLILLIVITALYCSYRTREEDIELLDEINISTLKPGDLIVSRYLGKKDEPLFRWRCYRMLYSIDTSIWTHMGLVVEWDGHLHWMHAISNLKVMDDYTQQIRNGVVIQRLSSLADSFSEYNIQFGVRRAKRVPASFNDAAIDYLESRLYDQFAPISSLVFSIGLGIGRVPDKYVYCTRLVHDVFVNCGMIEPIDAEVNVHHMLDVADALDYDDVCRLNIHQR